MRGRGTRVEMYIGMGKTGIPWVSWDCYGNGNGMGIRRMGMGIKTLEWDTYITIDCKLFRCKIHMLQFDSNIT